MTEERKQELEQLLNEAIESLEIRYEHARGHIYEYSLPLSKREYKTYLCNLWSVFSCEPHWFRHSVTPNILSGPIKTKLAAFLCEELTQFIEKDFVHFRTYLIDGNYANGFSLEIFVDGGGTFQDCLNHLLKIAIVCGVEEAVEVFERCSSKGGTQSHFQSVASLDGIRLGNDVQISDRVRLITLPDIQSNIFPDNLLTHLSDVLFGMRDNTIRGKTLLVIDRPVFSIFFKRSQEPFEEGSRIEDVPFKIELDGEDYTDYETVASFKNLFCQALSLACNSAVQISGSGRLLEERKFFHPGNGGVRSSRYRGPLGKTKKVGPAEIDEAKRLYHILDKNSGIRKDLRIPIDRWVKSKASGSEVDKIIDLGIAFEALYVRDGGGDTTYKLAIRAARHLGKDKDDREKLLKKFKQIYRCRSDAVHTGTVDQKVKFGEEQIPTSEFIKNVQGLCRRSILQIVNDAKEAGEFPDWDRLILGGDMENAQD